MAPKKSSLDRFIRSLRADNTKKKYRRGVKKFIQSIYEVDNETVTDDDNLNDLISDYLSDQDRDYRDDLVGFIEWMEHEDLAPKTIDLYLTGAKEFLFFNRIEMSVSDLKIVTRRKPRAEKISDHKRITKEMYYQILDHMVSTQGKALVAVLASSGLRISEALDLTFKDIDLSINPPFVKIRGQRSKNQRARISFISTEAREYLEDWIDNERNDYLTKRKQHLTYLGDSIKGPEEENRIFPIRERNCYVMWRTALKRAGLWKKDDETGRNLYTFHSLRRFFRTQLAGYMEKEMVEKLLGHEGYLDGSYYVVDNEDMARKYLQVQERLMSRDILEKSKDYELLEKKYDFTKRENEDLKKMNNELINDMQSYLDFFKQYKDFSKIISHMKNMDMETLNDRIILKSKK